MSSLPQRLKTEYSMATIMDTLSDENRQKIFRLLATTILTNTGISEASFHMHIDKVSEIRC